MLTTTYSAKTFPVLFAQEFSSDPNPNQNPKPVRVCRRVRHLGTSPDHNHPHTVATIVEDEEGRLFLSIECGKSQGQSQGIEVRLPVSQEIVEEWIRGGFTGRNFRIF